MGYVHKYRVSVDTDTPISELLVSNNLLNIPSECAIV